MTYLLLLQLEEQYRVIGYLCTREITFDELTLNDIISVLHNELGANRPIILNKINEISE